MKQLKTKKVTIRKDSSRKNVKGTGIPTQFDISKAIQAQIEKRKTDITSKDFC